MKAISSKVYAKVLELDTITLAIWGYIGLMGGMLGTEIALSIVDKLYP